MDNVKKFAETSADLYEAFKAYVGCVETKNFAETSKADMELAINKAFIEEVEAKSGVARAGYFSDKKWANNSMVVEMASAIRDVMIDAVLPETLMANAGLGAIADFRFAELGDTMNFKLENNNLYTVTKAGARRKHADMQRLFGTNVTLVPEMRQLTVGVELYDILVGRAFIAKEVLKAVRSIESAVYFDIVDALNAVNTNSYWNSALVQANPTTAQLVELCEKVAAYNGGQRPIIVGAPSALAKVLPSNTNYRFMLDDEYMKKGYVATFMGYDCVGIENIANPYDASADYALKLDANKIYIVSPATDKLVKVGFGGETMSYTDEIHENANLAQMATIMKAWDAQVITNAVAGLCTFSA